jgi:hypothetical protein
MIALCLKVRSSGTRKLTNPYLSKGIDMLTIEKGSACGFTIARELLIVKHADYMRHKYQSRTCIVCGCDLKKHQKMQPTCSRCSLTHSVGYE